MASSVEVSLPERVRKGDYTALLDPSLPLHLLGDGPEVEWWQEGQRACIERMVMDVLGAFGFEEVRGILLETLGTHSDLPEPPDWLLFALSTISSYWEYEPRKQVEELLKLFEHNLAAAVHFLSAITRKGGERFPTMPAAWAIVEAHACA